MPHETARALKCYAGGQAYCLDLDQVLAIERTGSMAANPASDGPIGWIKRWGKRIPVYGLAERLGTGARSNVAGAILVIDPAKPWGLAVERVSRFERTSSRPEPIPSTMNDSHAACFRGVVIEEGSPMLSLAPEWLHPDALPLPVAPVEPAPAHPLEPGPGSPARPGRLLLFSPPNPTAAEHVRRPAGRSPFLFGLSYTQIIEIVSGKQYIEVPGAPRNVLGLIVWRARPVAVVDVGALFGLGPATLDATSRLVVVHSPRWGSPVAIPVGREVRTQKLPLPHRPCRQPLALELGYARGVFEIVGEQVLLLPNVDAVACPASQLFRN